MALIQSDLFIYVAVVSAAYILIRKIWMNHQFHKFALANHCRPPPHSPNVLPWGLDKMWRLVRLTSKGADVMESVIMPSFRENGWTFQSSGLFGAEPLFTADPDNLRAIFATKFKDFLVGELRDGAFGYMVGKCVFTTDGLFWEHSRALFRPHFSTGQINNLEATETAVKHMLTAVSIHGQERWTNAIDLQPLFLRFTLDSGTEFLFGVNVNSQLGAIPGALLNDTVDEVTKVAADAAGGDMNFTKAFHIASVEVTKRAKLQSLYWLANSRKARRAVAYLQKFIDQLVANTLSKPDTGIENRGLNQKPTLLSALSNNTQDPIELRDQVLFALVASRDTTAAMLSWMFLMLAKHPSVFSKLRSTIIADFGTEDASTTDITMQTLKKCRYLQWVMYETLRLYPPGPLNSRIAARDTTLPTGGGPDGKSPIPVRKGQTINLCVYATQRREDLWGEDVVEFRPERWEWKKSDWTFLPFSAGPRTCLGQQYALTEAGYLTVRLLQRFDAVEAVDDLKEIPQYVTVTLEPKNGVKVRLRRASS